MNFLVFLRKNTVMLHWYMFSISIWVYGIADSKLVLLFHAVYSSLSLGIFFSIIEVADHPSPQKIHSLNHHKV